MAVERYCGKHKIPYFRSGLGPSSQKVSCSPRGAIKKEQKIIEWETLNSRNGNCWLVFWTTDAIIHDWFSSLREYVVYAFDRACQQKPNFLKYRKYNFIGVLNKRIVSNWKCFLDRVVSAVENVAFCISFRLIVYIIDIITFVFLFSRRTLTVSLTHFLQKKYTWSFQIILVKMLFRNSLLQANGFIFMNIPIISFCLTACCCGRNPNLSW